MNLEITSQPILRPLPDKERRKRSLSRANPNCGSALGFTLMLGLASLTAGCGLHPLYGSSLEYGGARQVFSTIYVDPIQGERVGYDLRNSLINDLEGAAKPAEAVFRLKVTVSQYIQGLAVTNNAAVTRYNYTLDANYELSDIHTNKVLNSGIEHTLSGYDVVTSPYATLVAQQDAQRKSAQDVADRIRIELSAYFDKHPAAQPAK